MKIQNNKNNDEEFGLGKSERSSVVNYKNNFNRLSTQNEYLTEKLREAESMIDMQNSMEKKIIEEYKNNVEKVKFELREKNKENEELTAELEKFKRKVYNLER